MKYLSAAFAALALPTALHLPSCLADQSPSDVPNVPQGTAAGAGSVPDLAASPQPRSVVAPDEDAAAAAAGNTQPSESQRSISAHVFGDSDQTPSAGDSASQEEANGEANNISPVSLRATPTHAEDDALVASIEAAVAESHVAALQDPASHCSSSTHEYTHFCRTLREFAAAALVSQQLEKKGNPFSIGFGKSKKSKKESSSAAPSMVELPPVETQAKKNEQLATEYAANVATATEKARGFAGDKQTPNFRLFPMGSILAMKMLREGTQVLLRCCVAPFAAGPQASLDQSMLQIFDGALHMQSGVMLLASMAKQLLHELLQVAASAPEGASISLDMGELEGVLRSVLVQGSSYAQPLAPYCAFIIQKALNDISTKAVTPEDARAAALIALTSLDNLVCEAAKQKAAATAETLGARSREINERVRALAQRHEYAGLPGGIGMQVIDIVLSVLENPQGVTVVRYSKTSPTGGQAQGPSISMTVETKQPPFPQVVPQEGAAGVSSSGAFGFQATAGPTAPLSVPVGQRAVDITYVSVPGLTGSAVGLTSLPFFQDLGAKPKYGARFHDSLTDYTLRNIGTPQDVCTTDAMVLPTGGLGFREGVGPTQSLGAFAASVVERWALRRAHDAIQPAVTLFRNDETIKQYATQLLEKHIASLKEPTSPAPSFNSLTSSGFSKYGFLDVCDTKCYTRERSRRSDVLASAIYTLDHTLAKLNSMAYRALTISNSFFGDLNVGSQKSEAGKHAKARESLSTMLSLWTAKSHKRENKNRLPEGIAAAMEDYAIALERYANMMSESPETRNVYNLAAHTWVQLRGIHNAAEGFLPGKGAKISERNKQVAAVFSKLWFEADPAFVQRPGSLLKPFPGLMASVALQVAFFLHSVVGEYKAGIWKQMGVAVKSFFVGLFRRNKRMKVPGSWKQVEARANPVPRTDVRGFQGSLHTISQLAKSFHDRFLKPALAVHDSSPFLPPYIAFIHGLVAQWMNPYGGKFSINDPQISKAKKLFYYSVFIHPKGLTYVAAQLIRAGCRGIKRIDVGKVRATVEHSGKRQAIGSTILRQKPVPVKGSALEYHLNMLLSTYDDPFDLIRVAQDLASRCQADAGLSGSTSFLEQEAGAEGSGKKRRFSFPKIGFSKSSESGDKKKSSLFKLPSIGFSKSKRREGEEGSELSTAESSSAEDKKGEAKSRLFGLPSVGFSKPKTAEDQPEPRSGVMGDNSFQMHSDVDGKRKKFKIPSVSFKKHLGYDPKQERLVQIMSSRFVLDTWCLKYKDFVAKTLTEVPKTTNSQKLSLLLEEALDTITEVVLTSATSDTNWVLNVKCPFMRDFIDAEMRLKTRRAMLHYAICSQPRPTKLMDFRDGKFDIGILGANESNEAVLCVKDDVYCWATRHALMFKGSTEAPIPHTEQPAGLWYSRLPGVSAPSPKGP
ncbi:hypothetical protein Emed_006193 [Eimeria media]